jgi:pimeloyl-ACP methyl ester carboxylesterase
MPLASVAGRKIYYESHGDGPGAPLVLVMGMAGTCRGWHALQVPELSKHHRVVIYDHRGVGESEDPGGAFTTADLADDLAALLDALEIPRAHVLGVFLGGMVAQELALRHPMRVARPLLAGCYARPDATRRLLLAKWTDMARASTPPEVFVRERLLWTLQDETLEQGDLVDAMARSFPGEGAAPFPADLFVRQCDACLAHDTLDRLHLVHQPTLLLCGRHDQLTPPKLHRAMADAIPGARLVTFQFGAHLVMAESALSFNRAVVQFLGENGDGPR